MIVTGGAGFIGSATIWQLNKLGYDDIICVDALRTGDKWKNLVGLRITDALHKDEFLSTLRRNSGAYQADTVIHFGACSSTTERDADYLLTNNTHYTFELCEWALERHARFIYASSAATYGDAAGGFDDDPKRLESLVPLNMYGFSKHLFDLQAARGGLLQQIVGLKFFNVFGPNEYHKGDMMSVVCKAHRQILATGDLELFESHRPEFADGEQKRDFVYVKDATAVIAWLVAEPQVHGLFNLGTGQSRSWNALAQAVFAAMQRTPKIRYIPMPESIRDRYQYYTQASMARLQAAGCPVKFRSLEDAVTDYVTQYLARDEAMLGVVGA
ncbi:MAG: ADP-glyceromanno-heptose 6-epimerase [Gemmatimonadaceae bacterium]|nr:ADP-glyceromanno-heptose 6-epimerase [Gemmatimonadaceae bacterium]